MQELRRQLGVVLNTLLFSGTVGDSLWMFRLTTLACRASAGIWSDPLLQRLPDGLDTTEGGAATCLRGNGNCWRGRVAIRVPRCW